MDDVAPDSEGKAEADAAWVAERARLIDAHQKQVRFAAQNYDRWQVAEAAHAGLASHDAALIEQARTEGEERGRMMTCEAHIARAERAERALAGLVAKIEALAAMEEWNAKHDNDVPLRGHHLRALIPADAATALDQVRAQAKAEALREAAEHLEGLDGVKWPIEGVNEAYVDWLRGRARRLGGAL